jgi:hypothetical protein
MISVQTREDHLRNRRRRMRQLLGLVLAVLMVVGAVTILRAGVNFIAQLFDDTAARQAYEDKLEGLVLFDPLPFDGIENIDDLTLREAAIWGCVYSIQETQGGFDNYTHDPDTEQLLLPAVEVDAYLAKLVGPQFKLTHQSFDMEDMTIEYDEALQSYRIPITGSVGYYRATVTDLFKRSGKLHVTVGYIPQVNTVDFTTTLSDTPTKYMDYLFERIGGEWYLTGLTESATKPDSTATEVASETQTVATEDLQSAIVAGVTGDAESEAASEAEAEADAEGEDAEADAESEADSEAASAAA